MIKENFNEFPKISIITVCFNAANKLNKTIQSVIEQKYNNIEYIIIDGNSTDDTKNIIDSYREKVSIFVSEPDNGIYDAMNKGINYSTGDLIFFLNAGDYFISSNALAFCINNFKLNQADLFFGRIVWEDIISHNLVLSNHEFSKYEWDLKFSNFPHQATFYKRSLFQTIGLFDLSLKILADYEWNLKAIIKYKTNFQYVDIVITLFINDGISNQTKFIQNVANEKLLIFERYLKPFWLSSFVEKKIKYLKPNIFFNKVIGKLYKKKLSRIY